MTVSFSVEAKQISPEFWLATLRLDAKGKTTYVRQFVVTVQQLTFLKTLEAHQSLRSPNMWNPFSIFKKAAIWVGKTLKRAFTSDTAKAVAAAGVAILKDELGRLALAAVLQVKDLTIRGEDKRSQALDILKAALAQTGQSVPERLLNLAIEFAVGQLKGDFGEAE